MAEAPNKIELYFDGVLKECVLTDNPRDEHGELLYVSEDGRFRKFPADEDLQELIVKHNENNKKKVTVIPEEKFGTTTTFDKEGNVLKVEHPE